MTPEFKKVHDKNALAHKQGLTLQQMADIYTEWAPTYENGFCTEDLYHGPNCVASKLTEIYNDKAGTTLVLDVAAGTGLLGIKLYAEGFRNIDGLDPSSGMLDLCKKKNIYRNLICEFMSEKTTGIETDAYDCIGISGGMGESHIPRSALPEMIRIVKSGGYVCIAMRKEYLDSVQEYNNNKLDDYMDTLEEDGFWQKVERTIIQNYSFKKDGVLYLYRIL